MNEPSKKESKASLRDLSRRAFLPVFILGIGGLSLLVKLLFIPKAEPLPDLKKPRFRKRRKLELANLDLSPGFYLNPARSVVHYLTGRPTFQFRKQVKEKKEENEKRSLKPFEPLNAKLALANPVSSTTHVNLSRSSYFFEQAAAAEIKNQQIDRACNLLFHAIQLELQSAYRVVHVQRFPPYKKSESLRLYDLLAGLSVRFEKPDQLKHMIELIKNAKNPKVAQHFEVRLKKWQDSNGRWHRRWSDKNKKVNWTVIKGLDLLM